MMVQTYKNMLHSFSSAGVNINIPPRWGAHVGVPPAAPAVCLMLLCPVITLDHGGRWLSRFLYWHHVLDAVTAAVVRSISQSCECRDHPVFVFFFFAIFTKRATGEEILNGPGCDYWKAQGCEAANSSAKHRSNLGLRCRTQRLQKRNVLVFVSL